MTTTINPNAPGVNASAATEGAKSENIAYLSAMKNHSLMGTAMVTMGTVMQLFTELANSKFAQMTEKSSVSRDAQEMANRVDRVLAGLAKPDSTGELPADVIEYMRENNILVDGKQTIDDFLAKPEGFIDSINEALQKILTSIDLRENGSLSGMQDKFGATSEGMLARCQLMQSLGIKIDGQDAVEYFNENHSVDDNGKWVSRAFVDKLVGALNDAKGATLSKDGLTAIKSSLESQSGRASDFVQQSQLKLQQLMQNFNTAVTMANSVQSMNAESTKSIAQSIR
ncbi:hypothetical protein [Serratia proteamaculans]|jgi:hypothetical protein